jgi:hypothetical protein
MKSLLLLPLLAFFIPTFILFQSLIHSRSLHYSHQGSSHSLLNQNFAYLFIMRFFRRVVLAATAFVIGQSLAAPITVHPGTAKDLIISAEDTINGTTVAHSNGTKTLNGFKIEATTGKLPLSLYNNLGAGVNAYITGKDINNQVVMLQPDGTFFYPNANGATTPQPVTQNVASPLGAKGSTTSITIPAYISAARIWFAAGNLQFYVVSAGGGTSLVEPSAVNPSDPSAAVNWGFVELTYNSDGVFANISYVDFVGLPLGMSLTSSDGSIQTAKGLVANAVSSVCNDLKAQAASDGQPWDQLCEVSSSGTPLRVLAPIDYISITPNAFSSYWTNYVDQVWSRYTSSALTIDTQAGAGKVSCQVSGGVLQCAGDNRSYAKPTATDIFGCNSGPFAIQGSDNDVHRAVVPRLCAAFNRSTLLLNGGNVQPSLPSTSYYTTSPTNHYSRVVHKYEVAGTGYAFSYDDVNPSGENQSGAVSSGNPTVLAFTVGGPN